MKMRMLNLEELIKYHPYHIDSFAEDADVTSELLQAAIRGDEELTAREIFGIVRLSKVPFSVLTCPKLIELDKSSYRHQVMIWEFIKKYLTIHNAAMAGDDNACYFAHFGGLRDGMKLICDFVNGGKVSYCRYLGLLAFVDMTLDSMKRALHRPRGMEKAQQKGGGMG